MTCTWHLFVKGAKDMSENAEIRAQESRQARFKRIASKRTNDIIRRIQILGNCSNRSTYDYAEEDINKVFAAIDKEVKKARARFTFGRRTEFRL
jgi:hypothetical protein